MSCMGNITTRSSGSTALEEACARTGDALDAQRVELYAVYDAGRDTVDPAGRAVLAHRWSTTSLAAAGGPTELPFTWFPWSLGNVRPEEYLFVRNAGALPIAPRSSATLSTIGVASVLHLPVVSAPTMLVGAVSVYWSSGRSSWSSDRRGDVCSWALDALVASR